MPTKTPAWAAHDGTLYTTAEQASRRDLFVVLTEKSGMNSESASAVIDVLLQHSEVVVEALMTSSNSRPGARKKPGTTSPRRAAKRATPAQAREGFSNMRSATDGGTNGVHEAVPAGEAA